MFHTEAARLSAPERPPFTGSMSVGPEPSDFYLSMQRIGWMAFPVLICIGYLVAAFQLP